MQNGDFCIRITSLYGTQTSPMVFCIQNSDFRTRITCLYRCQTSPMFFFAFKRATLAPELQLSMGPSPHLWFLHAKQPLLDQNYKSLWVPDFTYVFFCFQKSDISTRIASLYGSQPSSVGFACKTVTFVSELQVSMGPRPHLWFFAFKTATLGPELHVSIGARPHLCFFLLSKERH